MGLLDGPLRSVAQTLIGTLGTTPATFTRTVRYYDPDVDEEVSSSTTASLAMTPPAPFETRRVDGSNILSTDTMSIVAAADVDAVSFDFEQGSNVSLKVDIDGTIYSVVGINKLQSGDQSAAFELQLRN